MQKTKKREEKTEYKRKEKRIRLVMYNDLVSSKTKRKKKDEEEDGEKG